jgi:hypothetical protein
MIQFIGESGHKYVVGFMAKDGNIGRTFIAYSRMEVAKGLVTLMKDNNDFDTEPDTDHWDENLNWHTDKGTYFFGLLEDVGEKVS